MQFGGINAVPVIVMWDDMIIIQPSCHLLRCFHLHLVFGSRFVRSSAVTSLPQSDHWPSVMSMLRCGTEGILIFSMSLLAAGENSVELSADPQCRCLNTPCRCSDCFIAALWLRRNSVSVCFSDSSGFRAEVSQTFHIYLGVSVGLLAREIGCWTLSQGFCQCLHSLSFLLAFLFPEFVLLRLYLGCQKT